MQVAIARRHYDEIIASHYDFDPQSMIGDSLSKAMDQIDAHVPTSQRLRVLDVGIGTGRFLEKLRADYDIEPYGLDLSEKMIEIARKRIEDLEFAVDDAVNLDSHFRGIEFDLACTHFITGFVPLNTLCPKIHAKLRSGGQWTYIGGTQQGFPGLQKKARSKLFRLLFGVGELDVKEFVKNPADEEEVRQTLTRRGFVVQECETFRPQASFKHLKEFLEFAYYGGWLTPFIEGMGLHKAGALVQKLLNRVFFPTEDHHCIVIALARKE
jgi:SAM-dependent methyltransferase